MYDERLPVSFSTKLIRLQIGGPLFTNESWSIGMHFTTSEATLTPAADLKATTESFLTGLGSGRHATAKLSFIKFNEIDHATGKYVDQTGSNAYYYPTPFQPAGGTASQIPQASTCATLKTAQARGRGHSGRIYLPGYTPVGTTGHLSSPDSLGLANVVANYINSIALLDGSTPVVWSKIGDLVVPLTGVKIGSIVDTQRRRRSSLAEVYYESTVSIP